MSASRLWSHRALRATTTSVAAVALIAVGVSAAATGSTPARGPGYPPPKGIYAPFTNCPLNNPIMHEMGQVSPVNSFGGYAACVDGHAVSGSITIGTITTQVTEPVDVQFGFVATPASNGNVFPAPVYPPLAGTSALLSTKPDLIPESLTTALGCATATNATIQSICQQAQSHGGVYNQVYALAQEAGALSNFGLFTWTQPVKFQLINPLLGSSCSIGSDSNPVVLHPSLSVGPGGGLSEELDPQPTVHPDTLILALTGAVASDTTFSAPEVLGCGPGGFADIPVDLALDASSGLPAASGNSLTLNGSFLIAGNFSPENFPTTVPQPNDAAANLLAAFKASTSGEHSVKHLVTMSQAKSMFSRGG
jgi:hypothetical protein